MPMILALDQGTTSSRTLLFREDGSTVAIAQREFPQYYPQSGWVEQDPEEIWQSQKATIEEVLKKVKGADNIATVGITNQRETTILWDRKSGKPVHPAIVWQDRRTAELCQNLRKAGHEEVLQQKTGLLLDPYFSGTKIRWILDQYPELRKRAEAGELAFGTVDSWLVWKLTGGREHLTDVTNASRTLLFNLHTIDWDPDLCEILGVPMALLPRVVDTAGKLADLTELPGIPSVTLGAIAGDQQAALFGQGCLKPGQAKNTYGTGCFLLWQLGDKPTISQNRLLTTVGWKWGKQVSYALEGSIFMGGAIVQWLRDGLGIIDQSPDVEALAETVNETGDLFLVPAFTGLGAPHWDPEARGILIGLSRGTGRGHIARAALEAIAFQSAEVLTAMEKDIGSKLAELHVDGGASRNNLLLQIQADLLGVPVVRPAQTETTAWGAAALAGLGLGIWKTPEEIFQGVPASEVWKSQIEQKARKQRLQRWAHAVERSRNWTEQEIDNS